MIARYRPAKITQKSPTTAVAPAVRLAQFGPPLLLEGEDAAAYDDLLGRIYASVKPIDFIDEMFISDVISLEWEVLRWRRLKLSLMRARGLEALEDFLCNEELDYNLYSKHFADHLAEVLKEYLPEDQADVLAHECARNEPDAVDKVNKVLTGINRHMDNILDHAKAHKAKELVQEFVRREPDAVTLVHKLLTGGGVTMDALMADALAKKLDDIERIDRLTTIAENRRNASLREIERRRTVLGAMLRQGVQEIDAEYNEIAPTPAKGKSAH
jgi:hypothetical protein